MRNSITNDQIGLVSHRAATLLAGWLGVNPLAKNDNGDRSSGGGLSMVLAMAYGDLPPPPSDVVARMAKYIAGIISDKLKRYPDGGLYLTFDTDYGPGRELTALSQTCEIKTQWPIKSMMSIGGGGGFTLHISDCRGYQAEGLRHYLIDGKGWLVTPCSSISDRLMPYIVRDIERGDIPADVARIEAFSA